MNVITEEIDRLRTTAGSHRRIFVVETMGRHAGWLALEGGESSGAYIILIPEYDFEIGKINDLVSEGRRKGTRYDIVVVAEGAKPRGYSEISKDEVVDSFGHKTLGGIGEFLAREISQATKMETRSIALSHLQRGGSPCAYDRRMGRYFGIAAVDLIAGGAIREDGQFPKRENHRRSPAGGHQQVESGGCPDPVRYGTVQWEKNDSGNGVRMESWKDKKGILE